jgi:hypothetical protein
MDRTIWLKERFLLEKIPPYPCPLCDTGILIQKPKTLIEEETANTRLSRYHEDWEPTWDSGIFSCFLMCNNISCKEHVVFCGESETNIFPDKKYGEVTKSIFTPKVFWPSLSFFRIPNQCPDKITFEINASFSLYWINPNAAGNRLRCSIAVVLSCLWISRK